MPRTGNPHDHGLVRAYECWAPPPRRLHLSHEEVITFQGRDNSANRRPFKPLGLWYGFGNSWAEWCLSEEPHWLEPYVHEVVVDESKICKINNLAEFQEFEDAYGVREMTVAVTMLGPYRIDFAALSRRFAGLEINPYLYSRRLDSPWYYGWDCAAGVVWDADAVQVRPYASYDAAARCLRSLEPEKR